MHGGKETALPYSGSVDCIFFCMCIFLFFFVLSFETACRRGQMKYLNGAGIEAHMDSISYNARDGSVYTLFCFL